MSGWRSWPPSSIWLRDLGLEVEGASASPCGRPTTWCCGYGRAGSWPRSPPTAVPPMPWTPPSAWPSPCSDVSSPTTSAIGATGSLIDWSLLRRYAPRTWWTNRNRLPWLERCTPCTTPWPRWRATPLRLRSASRWRTPSAPRWARLRPELGTSTVVVLRQTLSDGLASLVAAADGGHTISRIAAPAQHSRGGRGTAVHRLRDHPTRPSGIDLAHSNRAWPTTTPTSSTATSWPAVGSSSAPPLRRGVSVVSTAVPTCAAMPNTTLTSSVRPFDSCPSRCRQRGPVDYRSWTRWTGGGRSDRTRTARISMRSSVT